MMSWSDKNTHTDFFMHMLNKNADVFETWNHDQQFQV